MDGPAQPHQPENYKREIAFILFRRTRLIILTALAIFGAAVAIAAWWPPTYGAYGSVLLKSRKIDRDPTVLENTELRSGPVTDSDLYSDLSIITSDELYGHVIATLERRGETEALTRLHEEPEKRVAALRSSVEARVVPTTTLIEVTLTSRDRQAAVTVLQALFDTYLTFRDRIYTPGGAAEALADKVRRMQQDIAQRNRRVADFLKENGLSDAERQIESNLIVRRDLVTTQQALDRTVEELRSEIAYLQEVLSSRDPQMLAAVHLPGSVLLNGRAEIASYLRQDESRLAAARESRQAMVGRIDRIDRDNEALRRNQLTYETMLQETAVLQRSYQTLLTRLAEATMDNQPEANAPNPYVSVLVAPRAFEDKLFPRPILVLPVGLVAGVMLGVALAFVKETLDHTFARPEDMREVLGIPVVLSIPAGGIRRGRWKGAASRATAALPAWAMRPRFLWLRRAVGVALVVVAVVGMVGLMASQPPPDDSLAVVPEHEAPP